MFIEPAAEISRRSHPLPLNFLVVSYRHLLKFSYGFRSPRERLSLFIAAKLDLGEKFLS